MNNTKRAAKVAASPSIKVQALINEMNEILSVIEKLAAESDYKGICMYFQFHGFKGRFKRNDDFGYDCMETTRTYPDGETICISTQNKTIRLICNNNVVCSKQISPKLVHALDTSAQIAIFNDPNIPVRLIVCTGL